MSACMLRAIKGKLPTKAFLKELNIISSYKCALCDMAPETIQHHFFEGPFSLYIWQLCRLKMGLTGGPMGDLMMEVVYIQNRFKKRKQTILARSVLCATIWHIWNERNARDQGLPAKSQAQNHVV